MPMLIFNFTAGLSRVFLDPWFETKLGNPLKFKLSEKWWYDIDDLCWEEIDLFNIVAMNHIGFLCSPCHYLGHRIFECRFSLLVISNRKLLDHIWLETEYADSIPGNAKKQCLIHTYINMHAFFIYRLFQKTRWRSFNWNSYELTIFCFYFLKSIIIIIKKPELNNLPKRKYPAI